MNRIRVASSVLRRVVRSAQVNVSVPMLILRNKRRLYHTAPKCMGPTIYFEVSLTN